MKITPLAPIAAASLLAVLGLSSSSCTPRRRPSETSEATASTATPPPPSTATANANANANATANGTADDRLPLAERLAREAAARPGSGPRVETVAAALTRSGIPVGPLRQVLGRTIGARFCMVGQTAPGLGVSICEFQDDRAAATGIAMSRRTFDRLIPNRRLERNRGTVLTLTRPSASHELDDQTERLAHLFASL
jgi:hypothetical protein